MTKKNRRFTDEQVLDMLKQRFEQEKPWTEIAQDFIPQGEDRTIIYRITLPPGAPDARYERVRSIYFEMRQIGSDPIRLEPNVINPQQWIIRGGPFTEFEQASVRIEVSFPQDAAKRKIAEEMIVEQCNRLAKQIESL